MPATRTMCWDLAAEAAGSYVYLEARFTVPRKKGVFFFTALVDHFYEYLVPASMFTREVQRLTMVR